MLTDGIDLRGAKLRPWFERGKWLRGAWDLSPCATLEALAAGDEVCGLGAEAPEAAGRGRRRSAAERCRPDPAVGGGGGGCRWTRRAKGRADGAFARGSTAGAWRCVAGGVGGGTAAGVGQGRRDVLSFAGSLRVLRKRHVWCR